MRSNIRDILEATKRWNTTEAQAQMIEDEINRQGLLYWSEATMQQVHKVAVRVHTQLTEADAYRFPKTYTGK